MNVANLDHIRNGLLEKRQTITGWLKGTPPDKRQNLWGPGGEKAIQETLQTLDTALEKTDNQTLDICTVCGGHIEAELLEMDYTSSVCLGEYSPEELHNLETELRLAQVVQRGLLPQQLPEIPGLELAVYSRPSQIVGGDYFDFVQFRDGSYGLALADIAGHGVSASLLMATIQTALRTLAPNNDSPAAVLKEINHLFVRNINFTTFVTMFLGAFNPHTHTLTYSNAGHNPPLYVHRQDGSPQAHTWLPPTGPAIGIVENYPSSENSLSLSPGDVLMFYTDGVTEATDPHMSPFGQERLAAIICREPRQPVHNLVQLVRQGMDEFTMGQPLADDTTIIALSVA